MAEIAHVLNPSQVLLSASKGIEEKTFLRMSQIMAEYAPESPIGTLGGPSFAAEVAAGRDSVRALDALRARTDR